VELSRPDAAVVACGARLSDTGIRSTLGEGAEFAWGDEMASAGKADFAIRH
jgi:hypothetical protein